MSTLTYRETACVTRAALIGAATAGSLKGLRPTKSHKDASGAGVLESIIYTGSLTEWSAGVHPYFAEIATRSHKSRKTRVRGRRRFLTSNIVVARSAALAGVGFTLLPAWLGWEAPPLPLSIGTPAAKHTQTKITLFIEELINGMKGLAACGGVLCRPPKIITTEPV